MDQVAQKRVFCVVSHVKNLILLLGQVVLCLGNPHFRNPSGLHIYKVSSFLPTDFGKRGCFSGEGAWEKLVFRREKLISGVIMDLLSYIFLKI